MTRITNPIPAFYDARGALIDGGKIYVGTANADPQSSPVSVYYDVAFSIPATQPLRTSGGMFVGDDGQYADFFVDADNYSIRISDAEDNEVAYLASSLVATAAAYQPLDSDLTAIAALSTTAYGRGLLTLASTAALKAATGIPDPLPAAGGPVAGNITRAGAGVHTYHVNAAYASGRVFGPEYTTDPTSQPGDIWFKSDA